jgi:hypothetical protein
MSKPDQPVAVELSAVILTVKDSLPYVMLVRSRAGANGILPSGPLASTHRKLQQGLRAWVEAQIGLKLGYVEQLYTFADLTRMAGGTRIISIGYLALTRDPALAKTAEPHAVYDYLPWEDHRTTPPACLKAIHDGLRQWLNAAPDAATKRARAARVAITFPKDMKHWNEELVLPRYELLWEAGMVAEKASDQRSRVAGSGLQTVGIPLAYDHRRILATGLARLRAKIKYRPVVFELLPERFTLLQLQDTVEALAGLKLHKQNFRRLVQQQGLVEETTAQSTALRGRPAQLYKFRAEVVQERAAAGTKLPRR